MSASKRAPQRATPRDAATGDDERAMWEAALAVRQARREVREQRLPRSDKADRRQTAERPARGVLAGRGYFRAIGLPAPGNAPRSSWPGNPAEDVVAWLRPTGEPFPRVVWPAPRSAGDVRSIERSSTAGLLPN